MPTWLAVVGLGLLGWVGASAAPSDRTPAPTSLFYFLDTDTSEASWLSYEKAADAWTGQVIPATTVPSEAPSLLRSRLGTELLQAPAASIGLPGPVAEAVSDVFDDEIRLLRVRVRSERGAPFMLVEPDAAMASIRSIGVDGHMVEVNDNAGPVVLMIEGLPADGVVVGIETLDRQPLTLDLIDWSWGLPPVDGAELLPRPPSLLRRPRWMTDSVLVGASHWF